MSSAKSGAAAATQQTVPFTPSSGPQAAGQARLQRLLHGPIVPMLARLAAPNIAVALAQAAVAVADAWFVGHLGIAALASLALIYPLQALMQMMSAGAMGGGVSSAIARALGSGRPERAQVIMLHALIIAIGMSLLFFVVLGLGARTVLSALGGEARALEGAVFYAHIAFGGAAAMWLSNTFASVLRGTGNMLVPAVALVLGVVLQIVMSGLLTLGVGMPSLGVGGPAAAMVIGFSFSAVLMAAYIMFGPSGLRLRMRGVRLQGELFRDILKVGALACVNSLLTIATVLIVTRLIAVHGTEALAGYGLGSRLELIVVPLAFGIGGALTASVGTNFGAGQYARARRIAWTGAITVGVVTGLLGVTTALWPQLWLNQFTADPQALAFGALYLAIVGPFYGMFGLGMALYFASQGTGDMRWPVTGGVLRVVVTAGLGALFVALDVGDAGTLFACVAAGMLVFGGWIAISLKTRLWNPERRG